MFVAFSVFKPSPIAPLTVGGYCGVSCFSRAEAAGGPAPTDGGCRLSPLRSCEFCTRPIRVAGDATAEWGRTSGAVQRLLVPAAGTRKWEVASAVQFLVLAAMDRENSNIKRDMLSKWLPDGCGLLEDGASKTSSSCRSHMHRPDPGKRGRGLYNYQGYVYLPPFLFCGGGWRGGGSLPNTAQVFFFCAACVCYSGGVLWGMFSATVC